MIAVFCLSGSITQEEKMSRTLESLTSDELALMQKHIDDSIAVANNCDPVDFYVVKQLVEKLYRLHNLEMPKEVYTGTQIDFLKLNKKMFMEEGMSEQEAVNQIRNSTGFWTLYGQHEYYWLSFYKFLVAIGAEVDQSLSEKVDCLHDLLRISGWSQLGNGAVFLCDRPLEQHVENDRLHNPNGPAFLLRDGHAIYQINGINLTEQIVMRPETQTIEEINAEKDMEVKRIRIERFGWHRYLEESNARCIHRRRNEIENTVEALFEFDELSRVLVTHCPSTGRIYSLEVPKTCETCVEAQTYLASGHSLNIPIRSIARG